MGNDYVLKHDFGYGSGQKVTELKKLNLRNFEDLQDYVNDAVNDLFYVSKENQTIQFLLDNTKIKIIIEE